MIRSLLIALLLTFSSYVSSQTYVVNDSCSSNTTIYQLVRDTTYSVKCYFRNQLLYDGFLIHPRLNKQYDPTNKYEYDDFYQARPTETGRCTLWLNNGHLSYIRHYDGKSVEEWTYENGKLSTHRLDKPKEKYYCLDIYDMNGKRIPVYVHDFNKKPRTKTSYSYIKGKLKKTVLIEDPNNGVYYPKNGKIDEYRSDGKLYTHTEYFKNSSKIRSVIYYQDDLINTTYYDEDKNEILTELRDISSGKVFHHRKAFYKKDASGFVTEHYQTAWNSQYQDTTFWVKRSLKDSTILVYPYYNKAYHYKIWFKNGQLNAIIFADASEPYTKTVVRQIGTDLYIQGWKNNELRMTRHVKYPKYYSKLLYFPNTVKELENQLYELEYLLNDEQFRVVREDDDVDPDETHYFCEYTDSTFKGGRLDGIKFFHDDTIQQYQFNGKTMQMVNHTHYLKAIKDLNQCAIGMKNQAGEWVVPARFDYINTVKNGNSLLYFCEAGTYTSVYTWDGKLLLPPTHYLITPRPYEGAYSNLWHLSKALCDSLKLSDSTILMVRHESGKKNLFINLHNELLASSNLRLHVQAPITNDVLDNMQFNVFDSLGRMGSFDLRGHSFPCRYLAIKELLNGDYIVQKDSSKEMQILDNHQQPINLPSFIDYYEQRYYDSLIIIRWPDSTYSSYNIFTRQLLSEKLDIVFDSEYDRNGLYTARKDGRAGAVNRKLQTVIPFKYSQIYITSQNYLFCRNNDSSDFYNHEGQLANQFVGDSIYLKFNKVFYYEDDNIWTRRTWGSESDHLYVYQKNQQYGLINSYGKLLTDRRFDKIAKTTISDLLMFFSGDKIEIGRRNRERDTIEFMNYFPAESFTHYRNIIDYDDNGIVDYKGNIIISGISSEHTPVSRYSSVSVFKDDKLVGLINYMGEWLLKTDRYQNCEIRQQDGLAYVTNKEGKAGIIDCSGKELVKVAHTMIHYDNKYHLLWYTDVPMPAYITNHEALHGFWRLRKGQKTLSDTLDYPTEFREGYSIFMNKHKRYGVVDSNLNVPYGFIFKDYNNLLYQKNNCVLTDSSGLSWLMDANFKCLKKFYADKVALINSSTIIVFRGDLAYTMSIDGKVLDSSYNFFTEYKRQDLLKYWDDEDDYDLVGFERDDDMRNGDWENEAEDTKSNDTFSNAQLNFIKTLSYYIDDGNHGSYNNCPIFPYPRFESYNFDYWGESYPVDLNIKYNLALFGSSPGYTLSRARLQSLQQYSNLYLEDVSGPILNYEYNYGRDYNNDLYTNFYFSENNTIYEFNLADLIEDDKHAAFNQLVLKTMDKLELKDIPCYKSPDFIELFNNKMQAKANNIQLIVDSDIIIEISYKDLESLMRKEWREKLLKD